MQDSSSTDYYADDELFADILDDDESLHDPITHPQLEDQVEEYNEPTQTFNSALPSQCMANTNLQTLPALLVRRGNPSPDAPTTSRMMAGITDLQSPNQLPDNSALDRLKLQTDLLLQELEQRNFQGAQSSTSIQPSQFSSTMRSQISSQNQNLVRQPTKPNSEQMNESEELQALAEEIRSMRMFLGYSREKLNSKLNELCCRYNMDEIFTEVCIENFEMQNMNLEDMLKLKPMLNFWLKLSIDENAALRSRRAIPATSLKVLEKYFQQNKIPTFEEIDDLAIQLNMDRTSVFYWFCNRRKEERKNKQISHTTNRFMPLGASSDICPITQSESMHATSSLNTTDFPYHEWYTKAPIATTGIQNLKPDARHTGMLPKPIPMNKKVMMARSNLIETAINLRTASSMPPSPPVTNDHTSDVTRSTTFGRHRSLQIQQLQTHTNIHR